METRSNANKMRFTASVNIFVYVQPYVYFTEQQLQDLLEQGVIAVEPWKSTRGRALEVYCGEVYPRVRDTSFHRNNPFALYNMWLHNGSNLFLGSGQLFAYKNYIDSIVQAIAELHIPGVAIVCGDVQFGVRLNAHAATSQVKEVIVKAHM